jgi:tetratricopeptide (TPR) repeat protein
MEATMRPVLRPLAWCGLLLLLAHSRSFLTSSQTIAEAETLHQEDLASLIRQLEECQFDRFGFQVLKVRLIQAGPAAVDPLLRLARSSTSDCGRQLAITILGELGAKSAVAPLLEMLRSTRPSQKRTDDRFILEAFMHPEEALIRSLIVDALGQIAGKSAVPDLIQMLRLDPDPLVRGRSAIALGRIRDQQAFQPLCEASVSAECDDEMRKAFLNAIDATGNKSELISFITQKLAFKPAREVKLNCIDLLELLSEDRALRSNLRSSCLEAFSGTLGAPEDERLVNRTIDLLRAVFKLPLYNRQQWLILLDYQRGIVSAASGDFTKASKSFEKCLTQSRSGIPTSSIQTDSSGFLTEKELEAILGPPEGDKVADRLLKEAYRFLLIVRETNAGRVSKTGTSLLFKVILFNQEGKDEEAIAEARKAVESDPNYGPFLVALGSIYSAMKRSDQALAAFRRALELDPKDGWAHYNLAVEYYLRKEYEAALYHGDLAFKILGFRLSDDFYGQLEAHRK